jgi:hypothetical protein
MKLLPWKIAATMRVGLNELLDLWPGQASVMCLGLGKPSEDGQEAANADDADAHCCLGQ